VQVSRETKQEAARLAREIAAAARSGLALPGTLTHRHTRCGRSGCRCTADPPVLHGPYWSWTRKIDAKTVTRYLSDDEAREYLAMFENARRLRRLVTELEALGLEAIGNATAANE
jgi:hypothetical protein